MSLSPLDSTLHGGLLGDPVISALFADSAVAGRMVRVEVALAVAQSAKGVIPVTAGPAIAKACAGLTIDLAALGAGAGTAGVPVSALVAQIRRAAGDAGAFVHWGATSQDIVDTGFVLGVAEALDHLRMGLDRTIRSLAELAQAHAETIMVGRTRWQQGVPITFGLKVANWLDPLVDLRSDLEGLCRRVLVLQLGGAAGSRAALGRQAAEVARMVAGDLGLGLPPQPWHTSRDRLIDLGAWLARLTGALGRVGQDVALLSQSEIGELRVAGGGGSSTMPHKANPVAAEMLVTAARTTAGLLGTLAQSLVAEQERSGIAWTGEWLTLPQMIGLTGGALVNTGRILDGLHVDTGRMSVNLTASNGLVLAEALAFALAPHLGREAAAALVGRASAEAARGERHLVDAVVAALPDDIAGALDREALADPRAALGDSATLAREAAARARLPAG